MFSEDFARATHHLSNRHIKREVDFIDHSLGVAQGAVVLDLACGTGEHSIELASRGYSVVGYDLSTGIPVQRVRHRTVQQPNALAFDAASGTLYVVSGTGAGVQVISDAAVQR